jgi:hypothetical protein
MELSRDTDIDRQLRLSVVKVRGYNRLQSAVLRVHFPFLLGLLESP